MICLGIGIGVCLQLGCSGKKVDASHPPEQTTEQKIESLTTTVSTIQSRLEEMDAKLSTLSDKVEANKIALDNLTGNKPLKTEIIESKPPLAPPLTPLKDEVIKNFTEAITLYKSGKYADAELAFHQFTEQHPEHILAGSAQFYAGEAYFLMGEYKLAMNEYSKVISSFASSPRVPSAMVRLAHCYEALGNSSEASKSMLLTRQRYPGNPSLEWNGPTPITNPLQEKLSTAPIEPKENKKGTDDEKIDDLSSAEAH